ncbi:MAG TPA: extracellular solute-binding protein, partial [Limnochordia bacterium]
AEIIGRERIEMQTGKGGLISSIATSRPWSAAALLALWLIGPGSALAAQREVTVYHSDLPFIEAMEAVAEEFMRENPDIAIVFEQQSGGEYYEALFTRLAGGSVPDIFRLGRSQSTQIRGYIEPVGPLLEKIGVQLDLLPYVRREETIDGVLTLFPIDWGTWVVYYHTELFDRAGVNYPSAGWTWTDFARTAQRLTRIEDGRPVQFGHNQLNSWWGHWVQLLWQAGTVPIDEAAGEPFPDVVLATRAFEFAQDLGFRWGATPIPGFTLDGASFENQAFAMQWGITASLFRWAADPDLLPPGSWDIGPPPRGDGPTGRFAAENHAQELAVAKDSPVQDAAVRFLAYLARPESQQTMFLTSQMLGASPAFVQWLGAQSRRGVAGLHLPSRLDVMFETFERSQFVLPDAVNWATFTNTVTPLYQQMLNDRGISPRAVVEQAKAMTAPLFQ